MSSDRLTQHTQDNFLLLGCNLNQLPSQKLMLSWLPHSLLSATAGLAHSLQLSWQTPHQLPSSQTQLHLRWRQHLDTSGFLQREMWPHAGMHT